MQKYLINYLQIIDVLSAISCKFALKQKTIYHTMDYPTLQGRLIMPEYGRNIQQMIAHALTIEDREERTRCVKTVINIMGNMFPYLRDVNDFKHNLS